jgi:hypothetical protein
MRIVSRIALIILPLILVASVEAQLRMTPLRGGAKIKLVSGFHSRTFDLDSELGGNNGSMPGDRPHVYRVLLTAKKEGSSYLVASVQSRSPISDKNAPCGGDRPQALILIKADAALKNVEFSSEIYASCSYNRYDGKLTVSKHKVVARWGSRLQTTTITFDDSQPEKGFVKHLPPDVN